MKLQLELPGIVRVRDTTNYKGNLVIVVSVFGEDVAYYVGRPESPYSGLDNKDWEDLFNQQIANFFGKMFIKGYPADWSEKNPTGREVSETDPVIYLSEEREVG